MVVSIEWHFAALYTVMFHMHAFLLSVSILKLPLQIEATFKETFVYNVNDSFSFSAGRSESADKYDRRKEPTGVYLPKCLIIPFNIRAKFFNLWHVLRDTLRSDYSSWLTEKTLCFSRKWFTSDVCKFCNSVQFDNWYLLHACAVWSKPLHLFVWHLWILEK